MESRQYYARLQAEMSGQNIKEGLEDYAVFCPPFGNEQGDNKADNENANHNPADGDCWREVIEFGIEKICCVRTNAVQLEFRGNKRSSVRQTSGPGTESHLFYIIFDKVDLVYTVFFWSEYVSV